MLSAVIRQRPLMNLCLQFLLFTFGSALGFPRDFNRAIRDRCRPENSTFHGFSARTCPRLTLSPTRVFGSSSPPSPAHELYHVVETRRLCEPMLRLSVACRRECAGRLGICFEPLKMNSTPTTAMTMPPIANPVAPGSFVFDGHGDSAMQWTGSPNAWSAYPTNGKVDPTTVIAIPASLSAAFLGCVSGDCGAGFDGAGTLVEVARSSLPGANDAAPAWRGIAGTSVAVVAAASCAAAICVRHITSTTPTSLEDSSMTPQ